MRISLDAKMWPLEFELGKMQPAGMHCVWNSDDSGTMFLDWLDYRDFVRTREYLIEKISRFCGAKITPMTVGVIRDYLMKDLPREIEEERQAFDDAISLKGLTHNPPKLWKLKNKLNRC